MDVLGKRSTSAKRGERLGRFEIREKNWACQEHKKTTTYEKGNYKNQPVAIARENLQKGNEKTNEMMAFVHEKGRLSSITAYLRGAGKGNQTGRDDGTGRKGIKRIILLSNSSRLKDTSTGGQRPGFGKKEKLKISKSKVQQEARMT